MAPADAGSPGRARRLSAERGLILHLGVLVQPYRARGAGQGKPVTTGDVAGWLEERYGILGAFVRIHGQDVIAPAVENSLAGAMESLLMGRRVDPWGRGMQEIQQAMRRFITSREAERVGIPGTPTKAALRGVNHRLAHPYRRSNPRRPSFRDTGLYSGSYRAWMT